MKLKGSSLEKEPELDVKGRISHPQGHNVWSHSLSLLHIHRWKTLSRVCRVSSTVPFILMVDSTVWNLIVFMGTKVLLKGSQESMRDKYTAVVPLRRKRSAQRTRLSMCEALPSRALTCPVVSSPQIIMSPCLWAGRGVELIPCIFWPLNPSAFNTGHKHPHLGRASPMLQSSHSWDTFV